MDNRLSQRYNNKTQQKPSQPTLKRHFLYQQKGRFFHGSTGKGVVAIKNKKRKGEKFFAGRAVWSGLFSCHKKGG